MSKFTNCSFCSTKREVGTEDLMIFEDTRVLKLFCGHISLPLAIGDLKSPFKGFVSCPDCHKLYQTLTDLYAQLIELIQLKYRVRGTIEELRCRMELSQSQSQPSQRQTNLDDDGSGPDYEDSNRSNEEKLRSAIMEKYSLEWPRVCGSPWTLNLPEPSGSHNDEDFLETLEESNDPVYQYINKSSKPKTHGHIDVNIPVLDNFEGGVNFKVTNRRKASKFHTMYSIRSAIVPAPEETKSQTRNDDTLIDASSGSDILPDPPSESGQCQPLSVLPGLEKRRTSLINFKTASQLLACSGTAVVPDPPIEPPSKPVTILPTSEEQRTETKNAKKSVESPKLLRQPITVLPVSVERTKKSDNAKKRKMSVGNFGLTSGISFVPNPASQPVKPHTKLIRPPLINTSRVQPIQSPVPRNAETIKEIESLDSHVWKILDIPNLPSRPAKSSKLVVPPAALIDTSRLNPNVSLSRNFELLGYDSAYRGSNRKWARILKYKTSDVQVSSKNGLEEKNKHFFTTHSQTKGHEADAKCSYSITSEMLNSTSNLNHTPLIESHSKCYSVNQMTNCTSKDLKMSPSPQLSTKKPRQRKSPVTSTSYLNYEMQDLVGGDVIRENVNSNESIQMMFESEILKNFVCEFCGPLKEFWDEEGLLEHLNSCHDGEEKRHACPIRRCKKTFVSNLLLEKHLQTLGTNSINGGHSRVSNPNPIQDYTCEFCPKIIRSVNNFSFVRHLLRHEREYIDKPLKCVKCGKGYASTFLLKRHVKRHAQDQFKPLACETCDARFSKDDQEGLEKHKKTSFFHRLDEVDKGLQNCRICDRRITIHRLLRNHEHRHHPELRTHQCNICDETYVLKSFLETHLKTHESTGPYTCSHCWNTCSSSETLRKHLISHTGLRNKYKLQAYQNTLTGYSNHVALRMNKNRKFQCSICSRGFSLQRYLNSHKKHCQAVWTCEICDKIFGHSNLLHFHKQFVHERPNKCLCEHCGKAFPAPSRLKIHLRTHADKSKWEFVCYFCNNRFISWSNLKGHMALHTNEKGYVCQVCKTTFMQQWQLRSHTKRRVCASK